MARDIAPICVNLRNGHGERRRAAWPTESALPENATTENAATENAATENAATESAATESAATENRRDSERIVDAARFGQPARELNRAREC